MGWCVRPLEATLWMTKPILLFVLLRDADATRPEMTLVNCLLLAIHPTDGE